MTSDNGISISFDEDARRAGAGKLVSKTRISSLVQRVFEGEGREYKQIGVIFGGHSLVTSLNKEWLEHAHDTDVLSFVIEDGENGLEGEVYVDVETAVDRHQEFNASIASELERYLIHGLLHLAGHDDSTDEERLAMRVLEDRYLAAD